MNIKINIDDENFDAFGILNVTDVSDNFLSEGSEISVDNFEKSDVSVINVLYYNNQNKTFDFLKESIIKLEDSEQFELKKDGWYTLSHILIPNEKWFNKACNSGIISEITVYYTDNKKVYKVKDGIKEEIKDLSELAQINTINTTINRLDKDYFSIRSLINCYINIAKKLLNINFKCINEIPKDLTFKRDFLWMTINVIKYSVELGNLEEATIRLNRINYCNGFCKDEFESHMSGCCN